MPCGLLGYSTTLLTLYLCISTDSSHYLANSTQYSLSCPGRRYSPHHSSAPGPWGPLAPGPRLPCSPNVQPYPPSPPTQPTTGPHTTGPHTAGSMLLQTPGKISIPSLPGHHGQSLTSRVSIPAAFPTYHHQAVHCQPASQPSRSPRSLESPKTVRPLLTVQPVQPKRPINA